MIGSSFDFHESVFEYMFLKASSAQGCINVNYKNLSAKCFFDEKKGFIYLKPKSNIVKRHF